MTSVAKMAHFKMFCPRIAYANGPEGQLEMTLNEKVSMLSTLFRVGREGLEPSTP